jgi:hypothetical protein
MNYEKLFMMFAWLCCFHGEGRAQEIQLAPTFGNDYRNARKWLGENKWIADSLRIFGVPPDEALSIVFPELIRYSALWDRMEVTGLIVLYIRLGKEYADFSVGHFQMKPSFIEELEKDAPQYLAMTEIRCIYPALLHSEDTKEARTKRVNDLTFIQSETRYLALFYKTCLEKFSGLKQASPSDRIRFLATAYNCGYDRPESYIRRQMSRKYFPIGNGWARSACNYASVSLAWWKESSRL